MRPVEVIDPPPGTVRVVMGEGQPEYIPLPSVRDLNDPTGRVVTEWELDAVELARLMTGGRIRLTLITFNTPLQPVILEVK